MVLQAGVRWRKSSLELMASEFYFQRMEERDLRRAKLKEKKEQRQTEALLQAIKVSSQSIAKCMKSPGCGNLPGAFLGMLFLHDCAYPGSGVRPPRPVSSAPAFAGLSNKLSVCSGLIILSSHFLSSHLGKAFLFLLYSF